MPLWGSESATVFFMVSWNTNDFHRPQSPLPWKGICSGSKLCLCICNS